MNKKKKLELGDYVFKNGVFIHSYDGAYYSSVFLSANPEDRELIIRVLKAHPFVSNYFDRKSSETYAGALKEKKDNVLNEIKREKNNKSPGTGRLLALQKSLDFYDSKLAELEIPDSPDSINSYIITSSKGSGRNRSMVTARGQAEKLEKLFSDSRILSETESKQCILWETVLVKTLKDVDRSRTLSGRLRMLFRRLVNFRKF